MEGDCHVGKSLDQSSQVHSHGRSVPPPDKVPEQFSTDLTRGLNRTS